VDIDYTWKFDAIFSTFLRLNFRILSLTAKPPVYSPEAVFHLGVKEIFK